MPCAVAPICLGSVSCDSKEVHVVTGANRGVGFGCAKALLNQGCTVLLLCRDLELGEAAQRQLRTVTGSDRTELHCVDLGDLRSVAGFCEAFQKRDYRPIASLVLNAGTISEGAVAVNHVGHFALTIGLLGRLVAGRATVVSVASTAHWMAAPSRLLATVERTGAPGAQPRSSGWEEYCDSKLANVLFVQALQRRVGKRGVRAVAYHPGVLLTDLWRGPGDQATEATLRRIARVACSCAVKHPLVSGAGAAALANPRSEQCCCCTPAFLTPREHMRGCCAALLCGDGGGYYQQCCCCTLLPVRPRPDALGTALQDRLWRATAVRVAAEAPELAMMQRHTDDAVAVAVAVAARTARTIEIGLGSESDEAAGINGSPLAPALTCTPACWCTEACSAAPTLCFCLSCVC